jgi:hypothetical protein
MRTAPALGSFLQRAFSGFSVVVVPFATNTTTPSHHILTPIFLRFSPLAFSSAVGSRQYLRAPHDQRHDKRVRGDRGDALRVCNDE